MRKYVGDVKNRLIAVRMLHVGLGSSHWHWMDVVFLLTGKVL
jgi:hypothetical protein